MKPLRRLNKLQHKRVLIATCTKLCLNLCRKLFFYRRSGWRWRLSILWRSFFFWLRLHLYFYCWFGSWLSDRFTFWRLSWFRCNRLRWLSFYGFFRSRFFFFWLLFGLIKYFSWFLLFLRLGFWCLWRLRCYFRFLLGNRLFLCLFFFVWIFFRLFLSIFLLLFNRFGSCFLNFGRILCLLWWNDFALCLFWLLFCFVFRFLLFVFLIFMLSWFLFGLEFRFIFLIILIFILVSFLGVLKFSFSVLSFSHWVKFSCSFNHWVRSCVHILSSKKLYFCLSDCLAALFYLLPPYLECVDSWIHSLSWVFWVYFLLLAIIYSLLIKIWSLL